MTQSVTLHVIWTRASLLANQRPGGDAGGQSEAEPGNDDVTGWDRE